MAKKPDLPMSHTGGVKPMSIEGRFYDERARLSNEFTDADRAWRKQWLKDQILDHDEPRRVEELERAQKHTLRRLYRYPMDLLGQKLTPLLGAEAAGVIRYIVPKFAMIWVVGVAAVYTMKYNQHDWTRHGGWIFQFSRADVLPNDPRYPLVSNRTKPQDYYDCGFKDRKVFRDI